MIRTMARVTDVHQLEGTALRMLEGPERIIQCDRWAPRAPNLTLVEAASPGQGFEGMAKLRQIHIFGAEQCHDGCTDRK